MRPAVVNEELSTLHDELSAARAAGTELDGFMLYLLALVQRGLESWRISTVGLGGSIPVVPFGDLENRWKNRRVEFVLTSR